MLKIQVFLVFLIGSVILTSGCVTYDVDDYAKNGTYSNPELNLSFNYPTDLEIDRAFFPYYSEDGKLLMVLIGDGDIIIHTTLTPAELGEKIMEQGRIICESLLLNESSCGSLEEYAIENTNAAIISKIADSVKDRPNSELKEAEIVEINGREWAILHTIVDGMEMCMFHSICPSYSMMIKIGASENDFNIARGIAETVECGNESE